MPRTWLGPVILDKLLQPGVWPTGLGLVEVGGRRGPEPGQSPPEACMCPPPLPHQVLRGGDPAEGWDLPADADGEGGGAHEG